MLDDETHEFRPRTGQNEPEFVGLSIGGSPDSSALDQDHCDSNYATSKHAPDTTVQSECLHHKTAWAYMIESDGFRQDSMQYLLKEHCVHDAKDAVEPCREVR